VSTTGIDTAALRSEVASIKWFHEIDLGNGIVTPGVGDSTSKLGYIGLPGDLRGWSVLDIGAWDGFFSFESERRGADRVVAVDSFSWDGDGWGTKRGFDLARRVLHSRVEDRRMDVEEITTESVGVFDLVLFMGVLYHMKHPQLSLDRLYGVTGKLAIIETVTDMTFSSRPAMAVYEQGEFQNTDPSTWCAPNITGLIAMLKTAGFRRVDVVHKKPPYVRIGRALKYQVTRGIPFWNTVQQSRVVVHAWR
jgi:tRNA (mo5U34)-methyltransferase